MSELLYRQPVARMIALIFGAYLLFYLGWRATSTLNPNALGFSLLLLGVEATTVVSFGLFGFMTWDLQKTARFQFRPGASVDIYVPTYDEDLDILEATLVGCNAITYPHTTYVLDDGRRPEVQQLAERLGCEYFTRPDNRHAKAGNLNAALPRTSGKFIAILDADTVPQPDFLDKTLGFFADERVALVQLPQEFYNMDSVQHTNREDPTSAWHEQQLFYRVIQPGKNRWNASFWCGSPSVARRSALECIGGVATDSITEDLETSLRLHANGWKTVYHNEVLAYGIAAQTLHAFAVQRLRWAQGTMQILRSRENPLILPGLTIPQRLCHFASMITYLEAYQKLAYLLASPIALVSGMLPVRAQPDEFLLHWLPYFALGILANVALGRGSFRYLETERYNFLKIFTFIWASTILVWPRPLRFRVTPKRVGATPYVLEREQLTPHILLLALIGGSVMIGVVNLVWGITARYTEPGVAVGTIAWALASGGLLTATVVQTLRRLHSRDDYRFRVFLPASISGTNWEVPATVEDLSVNGCSVFMDRYSPRDQRLMLSIGLPDGPLNATIDVMHETSLTDDRCRLGVQFCAVSRADRERLLEFLFVTVARRQGATFESNVAPGTVNRALAS